MRCFGGYVWAQISSKKYFLVNIGFLVLVNKGLDFLKNSRAKIDNFGFLTRDFNVLTPKLTQGLIFYKKYDL